MQYNFNALSRVMFKFETKYNTHERGKICQSCGAAYAAAQPTPEQHGERKRILCEMILYSAFIAFDKMRIHKRSKFNSFRILTKGPMQPSRMDENK